MDKDLPLQEDSPQFTATISASPTTLSSVVPELKLISCQIHRISICRVLNKVTHEYLDAISRCPKILGVTLSDQHTIRGTICCSVVLVIRNESNSWLETVDLHTEYVTLATLLLVADLSVLMRNACALRVIQFEYVLCFRLK